MQPSLSLGLNTVVVTVPTASVKVNAGGVGRLEQFNVCVVLRLRKIGEELLTVAVNLCNPLWLTVHGGALGQAPLTKLGPSGTLCFPLGVRQWALPRLARPP